MGNENRNNISCHRCCRAHQEGAAIKTKKKSLGINMNELQKITIRNSPHTKEGFVLKANFISSVVP